MCCHTNRSWSDGFDGQVRRVMGKLTGIPGAREYEVATLARPVSIALWYNFVRTHKDAPGHASDGGRDL
jgi:hypothetical protein